MSHRALVLDANILIRAVLGARVRRILEDNADNVSFFVPEFALSEAQEHLATLVTKRGGDPAKALRLLDAMVVLSIWSVPTSTVNTRRKRRSGSALAMRTTGRFSHLLLRLVGRSGPRTPTSSVVASRRGHPTTSISSWPIKVRARDSSTSDFLVTNRDTYRANYAIRAVSEIGESIRCVFLKQAESSTPPPAGRNFETERLIAGDSVMRI